MTADAELIRRITTGDEAAFAEFYDRRSAQVYGILVRMLRTRTDAEDVLQDVFWQVWSRAAQFDHARGTVMAWLILIARSRALDRRRRQVREPQPVEDVPMTGHEIDASTSALEAEQAHLACAALDNLPVEQKNAIQMAFLDGMSHSEIAAKAKLPLGTVKTRIRSGMTTLRNALVAGERDRSA